MAWTPSLIQWHEGMFLSPHHFQQLQRRLEGLLGEHLSLHHLHYYGVVDFSFDSVSLSAGLFRIQNLKCVMPDGLLVEYPKEGGEQALQVDLTPFKGEKKTVRVHVCVPEMIEQHSPVIGEWPRYRSVEGPITQDENLQDNVIAIPRLVPKLSLHVGDAGPGRYISFPIAEVCYGEGGFQLSPFVPPTLFLTPTHTLYEKASQLPQKLREKALFLSEKWQKQIGTSLLTDTANQLRPLLHVLPKMESVLRDAALHPHTLYTLLSEVMGELSTMRLSQVPPLMPAYNHNNIIQSVMPLFDLIDSYIDSIDKSIIVIPFIQSDRLFAVKLHASYLEQEVLLGIKAPTTMSSDELYDWVRDAVMSCDSMVGSARTRRIVGATRTLLDHEEMDDFLAGRGTLVFRLDRANEFVKAGEGFNVFNVADDPLKRPQSIVLYVKNKKDAA